MNSHQTKRRVYTIVT